MTEVSSPYTDLHALCRRRGFKLGLLLIGPTGHRARSEPLYPHGSLSVRVLIGDSDVAAGRCQSDPGLEHIDELAAGCLEVLRRKGVAC